MDHQPQGRSLVLTTQTAAAPMMLPLPSSRQGLGLWQAAGWTLMILALLACLPIAWHRAMADRGGTDFPEYYAAGRYVLEHGTIKPHAMTAYYLPSIDVVWSVIAIPPLGVSVVLWYILGALSYFALLRAIDRYLPCHAEPRARRGALLAAGLLVLPLMLDQLCLGAFNGFMLWWMVAGLGRIEQGRWRSGAMLLGLAAWIKLLPLLGVAYLVLKRRFAAALLAVATLAVVNVALSVAVFGIDGSLEAHRQWWQRDAAGTTSQLLSYPEHLPEQRVTNQSLTVVLRRTLTRLGYPSDSHRDLVAWGTLSAGALKGVYFTAVSSLLLAIAWYCRRRAEETPPEAQATEIALIVLSTLWFTPIAPSYHPLAALPAIALLQSRRYFQPVGWSVAILWLIALGLHAAPLARAAGHMLWTTMALGVLLVLCRPGAPAATLHRRAMQPGKRAA